jgi:hypothetical protein
MKTTAAPLKRTEREAKDQACEIADELLLQHYRRIPGLLLSRAHTVHSWSAHAEYASPRHAFTILVPTKSSFRFRDLRELYAQTKRLFKDLGEPVIFGQQRGMIIAIGFNTDLERLEHLKEIL